MNRAQFNKVIVPGLFSFASESYKPRSGEQLWKKLAKIKTSNRAYMESAYYGSLGLFPVKPEGENIAYDEMVQGPTKRWTHRTFGLGLRITEELIEDSLYDDLPTEYESFGRELGESANETLEVLVHDVINSGTVTTTHTDGLGNAIFSTGKVRLRGGTWDNLLSPAADLSATSLQAALDAFENTRDDAGKIQIIKAKEIWVAPANAWKAKELLNSAYDPESANNSVNTIKERNLQLVVSPFLTDTDAFTLIADPPHSNGGIIAYLRRKPTMAQDGDFQTGDALFKMTFRFSVEDNKPNNLFHSAGA